MMIAEAGTLVRAPLADVREAVLTEESYTQGDTKVAAVEIIERHDDGFTARIHGALGPFRSSIIARYTVKSDELVDLAMESGRLRGFHAVFEMTPRDGGVWLVHREEYDFGYGPLRPLLDRALRGWARKSVEAEVEALRRAAEKRAAARA